MAAAGLFQDVLGDYLLPKPRIPVAVVFYLGYVALIVGFAVDRAGGVYWNGKPASAAPST